MNAKRKEKAIKDFAMFAALENDELVSKLVDAGYDEEKDIPEILSELKGITSKKFNLSELNETEDEDGQLVYTDCEQWKEYQKEVNKLDGSKQINFIKMNAVGCFRTKLNSKGDKVQHMVGLRMIKDKPVHITKIDVHTANRLNAQIWNTNNLPECSIFYLVESLINY